MIKCKVFYIHTVYLPTLKKTPHGIYDWSAKRKLFIKT